MPDRPTRDETAEFEDHVRDVARALWPAAQYGGAVKVAGRERDAIFETDDVVNYVEATVSKSERKAREDGQKLLDFRKRWSGDKPVVLWLVTKHEPTGDQRSAVGRGVRILSFHDFRGKLINARRYLDLRQQHHFGSARDPKTGKGVISDEYIRIGLLRLGTGGSQTRVDLRNLEDDVSAGRHLILVGDYGEGKSMTLRELFRGLATTAKRSKSTRFPVHLNLREHTGQDDPSEALIRHARRLGYSPEAALVSAWRAGYCHLLLDGFDELALPGWGATPLQLKDVRNRSMELVRVFIRESPPGTGIAITGRAHYFDNEREMATALQPGSNYIHVKLAPMTDEQMDEYLRSKGWKGGLPSWVPRRPLLLGYLASRGLLDEVSSIPSGTPQAAAWDQLLTLIAVREAEIDKNIRPEVVRRIIERIASVARESSDGLGPILAEDVTRAFVEVVGRPPDEGANTLLQRLPGLGPTNADDGTRVVVDSDLADCASAGDVVRYALAPFSDEAAAFVRNWKRQLQPLGAAVAAVQWRRNKPSDGLLAEALRHACSTSAATMGADLLLLAAETETPIPDPRKPAVINAVLLPVLDLADSPDMSGVTIRDSLIETLELAVDAEGDTGLPLFQNCIIGLLNGRFGHDDLPKGHFVDVSVDRFSASDATTAAILASHLHPGIRVALSVLRKVYVQSGAGRKESALVRGLDPADRPLVTRVLQVLQREELIWRGESGRQTIWLPYRTEQARVQALLAAPTTTSDPVMAKVKVEVERGRHGARKRPQGG